MRSYNSWTITGILRWDIYGDDLTSYRPYNNVKSETWRNRRNDDGTNKGAEKNIDNNYWDGWCE